MKNVHVGSAMRGMLTLSAVLLCALIVAGCESRETPAAPDAEASSQPSQPQFQPKKLPPELAATTMPATRPLSAATLPSPISSLTPSTLPAAATLPSFASTESSTRPTSRPADPMETPQGTVRKFMEINAAPQLPDDSVVLAMILEPPPMETLYPVFDRIRRRLLRGATWEIVQTEVHGAAASVIYKVTYNGREEVAAFLLFNQHDRWKMIFGELTPRRYTSDEKDDIIAVGRLSQARLTALRAALSTQPVTTRATTQTTRSAAPTSGPATTVNPR